MYDYIKGTFTYKTSGVKGFFATVQTGGGVGYLFEIMERDYSKLPDEDNPLKLYCVLIHREDKMSLCGFLKREDRDIFNILTSVSGVGAKMALMLLNSFEVSDLVGFVLDGNFKELTKAKGVGPKLAQKIILELKDKLTGYKDVVPPANLNTQTSISSQNVEDAQMVLVSLGYDNKEISAAISKVLSKISAESPAEEILKEALRILSV